MTTWWKTTHSPIRKFIILLTIVLITSLSQGLLLPLLTIFLEQMGVSSTVNALNATMLYLGAFVMMFFVERILMKLGCKKMLLISMGTITITFALFSLNPNHIMIWFGLSMLVGFGNSALHYVTQLWAISVSPSQYRGRNISLYGMLYGAGFYFGPLGIYLLALHRSIPFIMMIILFLLVICLIYIKLPNEQLIMLQRSTKLTNGYVTTYQYAWFALLPTFLYGYMESSMNNNFPVYALRLGIEQKSISYLLLCLGIGGLLLQVPLGILSDRIGPKRVLITCGILGSIGFCIIPFMETNLWGISVLFLITGGLVGSFFSLGLAYTADILPAVYLPVASVLASIHFGLGSIIAPNLAGISIEYISINSMFYLLGGWYMIFSLLGFKFKPTHKLLLGDHSMLNKLSPSIIMFKQPPEV